MNSPQKILVPVDLSKRAERGVEYGAMLASAFESELVVMINVGLPEREMLEDFVAIEHTAIDHAADAALKHLLSEQAPKVRSSVVVKIENDPAEAILAVAEAEGVDMIVMASHGRSGMSRWMLGSIAEKILRSASVPVVVVPARD